MSPVADPVAGVAEEANQQASDVTPTQNCGCEKRKTDCSGDGTDLVHGNEAEGADECYSRDLATEIYGSGKGDNDKEAELGEDVRFSLNRGRTLGAFRHDGFDRF